MDDGDGQGGAMRVWGVSIEGTKGFAEEALRLTESLYDDEATKVYLAGAREIQREAQKLAPRGRHVAFTTAKGYRVDPGRLRRAIVARTWRQGRDARRRYGPGAYVQVNLKRKSGKETAPYGHIVEGGRRPVVAKKSFLFWREGVGDRDLVKVRRVAGYSGRNYFQRAVAATAPRVLERMTIEAQRQIEKRYR